MLSCQSDLISLWFDCFFDTLANVLGPAANPLAKLFSGLDWLSFFDIVAGLFAALAELVGTYGEDAVAKFVEDLPLRVRSGEFSVALAKQ